MPFVSYVRSDFGFLRRLPICTGVHFNTQTDNPQWQGPPYSAGTTAEQGTHPWTTQRVRLLYNMPPGSWMFQPVHLSTINSGTSGQIITLFGFNIKDQDGNYTGKRMTCELVCDGYGWKMYFRRRDNITDVIEAEQASGAAGLNNGGVTDFAVIFSPGYYDGHKIYNVLIAYMLENTDYYNHYNCGGSFYVDYGSLMPAGGSIPDDVHDDPNEDDDGHSGEGGGGGSHDHTSDIVREGDITDLNPIGAANCGFVTLYKATLAQLQQVAEEVYSSNVWDIVKNWWNKPIEMVAGLMLLPVTPASGATYKPKIGTHVFNVAMPIVGAQYKEVDCGSLYIDEYYASCFDYSPYTRISLFLPFIGMRELNVDEIMGKTISVKYRIDCFTGNCLAILTVGTGTAGSNTVRYQFPGNCGQQVPTSSADFSAVINGAIQFATVAVASVITAGGAGAAAGAAATGAGATAAEAETVAASAQAAATTKAAMDIGAAGMNAVMNSKPRVERSGSMGESMGMMGVLKPYILKEVPRQSLPDGYKSFYGYPANISGTIGSFSGFTVVDSVKLKGIPGTDAEIAEIENILKGGVYV